MTHNRPLSTSLPQHKDDLLISKPSQNQSFLNQFNISTKHHNSSLDKNQQSNYGRKIGRRRSEQINAKDCKSQNGIKIYHRFAMEQKNIANCQLNFTNYKGNHRKNMKKMIHNYSCSSQREQNKDYIIIKKEKFTNQNQQKRQITTTNPSVKQIKKSKIIFEKSSHEINMNKSSLKNIRKYEQNGKIPTIYEKKSFIQLINKYKFQNLKINNPNSTSNQFFLKKKSSQILVPQSIHSTQNQQIKIQYNLNLSQCNYSYKQIQKQNATKKINRILKKMDSILSPWRTVNDQPFNNQSPFAS